jgi:hypothetical protein
LDQIANRLSNGGVAGVDFQVIDGRAYSVADQFELLAAAVGDLIEGRRPRFPLKAVGLLGPESLPPAAEGATHLTWFAFRDASRDALDFIKTNLRVPSRVFVGADAVPPADFLVALASAYQYHRKTATLPLEVGVTTGKDVELLPARRVARDTPELFGGWVIHKEGFRAPKILEVARLQTWTLKPAIPKGDLHSD